MLKPENIKWKIVFVSAIQEVLRKVRSSFVTIKKAFILTVAESKTPTGSKKA